jgi:hypothetical protein
LFSAGHSESDWEAKDEAFQQVHEQQNRPPEFYQAWRHGKRHDNHVDGHPLSIGNTDFLIAGTMECPSTTDQPAFLD